MSHDPIEAALLARLLVRARKAPSEAAVLRSLRAFLGDVELARLRGGLARLREQGLCTSALTLSPQGRARAREALGLEGDELPTDWPVLKGILVEVALGHDRRRRSPPLTAGAVRAAALASRLDLPLATSSAADVLDAWAARELGMEGQRLTVANVRAHVLSRALGIGAIRDPKRIGAVAAAKVLGVPRADASSVRRAVLRDWLRAEAPEVRRATPGADAPSVDLLGFAAAVKDVAREAADGRFGRHKVFIGPIWRRARAISPFSRMEEAEFKARLVDAHRAGLLRLSRADLTPAMAPELVAASEAPYLNGVFHFVDLEGSRS